jgi:two-component system sensor histidine kinase DesK
MMVWLIWLVYMFPVIGSLLDSHPSPPRLIGSLVGAAVFIAIYTWMAWQGARKVVGQVVVSAPRSRMELWLPVVALLALSIILTGVNGPSWGALFVYTCAGAAGRLPTWSASALLVGVELFSVLYAWLLHLPPSVEIANAFTLALASVTTIAMVWSVMWSRRMREEREELSRYAAVAEERLRIARDLHDLLGHNLSLIALKSELAGRLIAAAPERAAAEIGDVERVARTALQEVREAVAGYRQPTLASELHGAREVLAAAGIAYEPVVDASLIGTLPAPVEAALAWAVREGITNVVRHSRARHCSVMLGRDGALVRVEVTDDGPRVVPQETPSPAVEPGAARDGNGLRGLAERVAALGGAFAAGPRPGGGFLLAVAVSVEQQHQQAGAPPAPVGGKAALVGTHAPPSAAEAKDDADAATEASRAGQAS